MNDDLPYDFQPVYPITAAINLAKRVKADPSDAVTHGKHACGVLGCVLEKHDSEPEAMGAMPDGDYSGDVLAEYSVEELADAIIYHCAPRGGEEPDESAAIPPVLIPILAALVNRLLKRLFDRD